VGIGTEAGIAADRIKIDLIALIAEILVARDGETAAGVGQHIAPNRVICIGEAGVLEQGG
jgi:hypothetical protein